MVILEVALTGLLIAEVGGLIYLWRKASRQAELIPVFPEHYTSPQEQRRLRRFRIQKYLRDNQVYPIGSSS